MARQGSVGISNGAWYLRIYIGKKQRRFLLGYRRQFETKKQVREAVDRKLLELQRVSTGMMSRITLEQFIRSWYLTIADGSLQPSTARGYRGVFKRYIEGTNEVKRPVWEYRTRDCQALLNGIAQDHDGLSQRDAETY